MPFEWLSFLELAKELMEGIESRWERLSEAVKRTVVSRAYYSAFCYIRNYEAAHSRFTPTNTAEDHKNLIKHLKNIGRFKIATTLRNLREYRNDCDYADSIENIDKIVRKALLDAEELLRVYRES
jgi:uncharacterized protein (UPF0332 family)